MGISHALALCILSAAPLPPASWNVESALGLEMIWVDIHSDGEPITFTKGSPEEETGHNPDENQHKVTLTQGFYLGKFEVTQAEYQAVLQNNPNGKNPNPSGFPSQNQPVENLSWDDANYFIERLNLLEHEAGHLPGTWSYTLPTEAEWEYATRGGVTAPRWWGWNSFEGVSISDACEHANVYDISAQAEYGFPWPHARCKDKFVNVAPVASFDTNPFGLYDTIGNLREWTADCYTGSYVNRPPDSRPWVWQGGCELRPVRGGSWATRPLQSRSANRQSADPDTRSSDIGFRVVKQTGDSD